MSSKRKSKRKSHFTVRRRNRGAAVVEWVISLPLLLLVGLGCLQWLLIWEARSALNYATLLAARAGAVHSLEIKKMEEAFDKGVYLFDQHAHTRGLTGFRDYRIRILNPTVEAFKDFGEASSEAEPCGEGAISHRECEIPIDRLERRDPKVGKLSALNIQDANLLKIEVVYAFELKVPFIAPILGRWIRATLPFRSEEYLLSLGGLSRLNRSYFAIPITTTATVRMQSPARFNSRVLSREEVEARAEGKLP